MNFKHFNPQAETLSQDQLRQLQTERLRAVCQHVFDNNALKREQFKQASLRPEDIRALDDIQQIPTMDKEDLRRHYPLELSCVPQARVAEIHMSSGSTGTPIVMPYTEADLGPVGASAWPAVTSWPAPIPATWSRSPPRSACSTAASVFITARAKPGCSSCPPAPATRRARCGWPRDFKTSVLTAVVSYGVRVMEVMEEEQVELPALRIGMFGAEVFSEALR